jgi:hypothetical protein
VLDSELCGHQASHDLDRMQILIDVSELGVTGYQAADWLRTHGTSTSGWPTIVACLPPCPSPMTSTPPTV